MSFSIFLLAKNLHFLFEDVLCHKIDDFFIRHWNVDYFQQIRLKYFLDFFYSTTYPKGIAESHLIIKFNLHFYPSVMFLLFTELLKSLECNYHFSLPPCLIFYILTFFLFYISTTTKCLSSHQPDHIAITTSFFILVHFAVFPNVLKII